MSRKGHRCGTAIVVVAGLSHALQPASSQAGAVGAGGSLALTVTGFATVNAHGGALDDQRQDPELSTGLDFSTDTDATSADESWIFLRGGWGELRFGDVDGPVEASALGADTIAAGTGGIDGEIVDELAVSAVRPTTSEQATKIRYHTPSFAGFQLGLGYTPDAGDGGDALVATDTELSNWVEGAAVYEVEIAGVGLLASLVGSVGETDGDELSGRRSWAWYAGAATELEALDLGAGIGRELGPLDASVTYGKVLGTDGYPAVGRPWNLVFSADRDLLSGLALQADLAYFDNDLDPEDRRLTGGDSGWVWVTRLELSF